MGKQEKTLMAGEIPVEEGSDSYIAPMDTAAESSSSLIDVAYDDTWNSYHECPYEGQGWNEDLIWTCSILQCDLRNPIDSHIVIDSGATSTVTGKEWISSIPPFNESMSKPSSKILDL